MVRWIHHKRYRPVTFVPQRYCNVGSTERGIETSHPLGKHCTQKYTVHSSVHHPSVSQPPKGRMLGGLLLTAQFGQEIFGKSKIIERTKYTSMTAAAIMSLVIAFFSNSMAAWLSFPAELSGNMA